MYFFHQHLMLGAQALLGADAQSERFASGDQSVPGHRGDPVAQQAAAGGKRAGGRTGQQQIPAWPRHPDQFRDGRGKVLAVFEESDAQHDVDAGGPTRDGRHIRGDRADPLDPPCPDRKAARPIQPDPQTRALDQPKSLSVSTADVEDDAAVQRELAQQRSETSLFRGEDPAQTGQSPGHAVEDGLNVPQ